MINVIATVVTGFVVGVLARFFYPGPVPMTWLWTIVLGVAGSVLAGLVASGPGSTAQALSPRWSGRWRWSSWDGC